MVISVVNEKGGTGKSTIAVNLAGAFLREGKRVLLVDADLQKSVLYWADLRREREAMEGEAEEKGDRLVVVARTGKGLDREVRGMGVGFDVVIIDTGGRDSVEMRKAMLVADVVVIPVTPSQFDAWSLERTLMLFENARSFNEGVIAGIVLNRVPFLKGWQKRELKEMREFFEEIVKEYGGIFVMKSFLTERVHYKKVLSEGFTIFELEKMGEKNTEKIEKEFFSFFEEVKGLVEKKSVDE